MKNPQLGRFLGESSFKMMKKLNSTRKHEIAILFCVEYKNKIETKLKSLFEFYPAQDP